MNVFEEGVAQHGVIGGFANNGGDGIKSGELCCTESAFPHDEFEAAGF